MKILTIPIFLFLSTQILASEGNEFLNKKQPAMQLITDQNQALQITMVHCASYCRGLRNQCLQTSSYAYCNAEFVECMDTCLAPGGAGGGNNGGGTGGDDDNNGGPA